MEKKKPRAFLLENVKQLYTHDEGRTFATIQQKLKELGYYTKTKVLNSLDFGLPQKRERTYIVGFLDSNSAEAFDFPVGERNFDLAKILEPEKSISDFYYASDYIKDKRLKAVKGKPPKPSVWHENVSGNISALPYSCALRASGSYNYLLVNGIRRFTERELLRLQGFPDSFKIVVGYSKTRHQAGNSVSVPVIEAIAKRMDTAMTVAKKKSLRVPVKSEKSVPKRLQKKAA